MATIYRPIRKDSLVN